MPRGLIAEAREHFAEGLRIACEYGNMLVQIFALVETAVILARRDRVEQQETGRRAMELRKAARLCGAPRPFVENRAILRGIGTQAIYDSLIAQVQSGMEPEIWERGFSEGASLPFEEALDIATLELSQAPHQDL